MSTSTRFEKEVKGNLEMAYCPVFPCSSLFVPCLTYPLLTFPHHQNQHFVFPAFPKAGSRFLVSSALLSLCSCSPKPLGNPLNEKEWDRVPDAFVRYCTNFLGFCFAEMRFCIAFLCIIVAVIAVFVGRIYQRLLDLSVPEEFPINSTWQYKLVGFSNGLVKDLVSCMQRTISEVIICFQKYRR